MEIIEQVDHVDTELIRHLYPLLRRFAAVAAPWDMDPDDVLHGALAATLQTRRLGSLDDPEAYLRRAIVNHVRSELRSRRTSRSALRRLEAEISATTDAAYPSDVAELMRLRPAERAILYLHDIEGYSFDEVAGMVGLAAGNVRVTASRARRRLKAELQQEES